LGVEQVRESKIMKLLESLEMVRHAMPGLTVEQQHNMVQEIAVSIQNVRNGVEPSNFVGERWQKVCCYPAEPFFRISRSSARLCMLWNEIVDVQVVVSLASNSLLGLFGLGPTG
jgi:hypothetical protein